MFFLVKKRMMVVILSFFIFVASVIVTGSVVSSEILSPIALEIRGLYDVPEFKKRTEIKSTYIKHLFNAVDKIKALESKTGFFDKAWNHLFYTGLLGFIVEPSFSEGLILLTEDRAPKLHMCVENLCKRLIIPKPMIFLVRDKEFFNAAATSFSHHLSCIIIGESLLNKLTEPELNNLLAHELAHIKHNHAAKRMGLSLGLFASSVIIPAMIYRYMTRHEKTIQMIENSGFSKETAKWTTIGSASVLFLCSLVIPILMSRPQEKEADMTALQATQDKVGFVGVMQKLEDQLQKDFSQFSDEYRFFLGYLEKLDENQSWFKSILRYFADSAFYLERSKLKSIKDEDPLLATHPSLKARKEYGAAFKLSDQHQEK